MAVVAELTLRGVSREEYDAVRARAGWLEEEPVGELAHLTWWEGEDCHNLDGWESEAAFEAFGEQRLRPAMAALGLDVQLDVRFHPAHEIYTPRRTVVAATPVPEAVDTVARTKSGYYAFTSGDIPAVLDLFAPDIVWSTPDSLRFGGRYTGRGEILEFFSLAREHIAELHVEPETYIGAADSVVVLGRYRGRTALGKACEVPWVHIWTWHDGKATSFTDCFDAGRVIPALRSRRAE